MTLNNEIRWVRLGDYITQRREKNNNYDVPILGVTRDGFIPPKQEGADTSLYNVFYKYDFVFNPARMELNSIYLNVEYDKAICSSLYEIFYVNKPEELLPEYLNLFIKRNEFARFCWYDAMGSARNYFRVANMQDMRVPLPSPEKQRELVATWKGLRDMKEQNEAMAAPLMQLCQSRLQELKHKHPLTEIGPYIEQCDERNSENVYTQDDVRGISTDKKFLPTKANLEGVSLTSYKVVSPMDFAYVADTSRRGDKIALALNTTEDKILISSIYTTFKSKDLSQLLPEYLYLMMSRSEFDRYARFHSWGSARETFDWDDMCRVAIPLPSIEEQQAIVNIYKCAAECKRIAEEADRLSREICPALMQKAIRG